MSGWRMTLGVLAVLLAGLLLVREEGPGAAAPRVAAPPPPAKPIPQSPTTLPPAGTRNVFAYGVAPAPEGVLSLPTAPVAPAPVAPASVAPPAPAPVRLVGVVHQGGALKAALALGGEVVMLGVGEERDGYRVESIDEESGVRVKGPSGAVWVLAPD